MPGFPVPSEQLIVLTSFIRGINSTASVTPVPGDAKAGEGIFFGSGGCSLCHMVHGQGGSIGPDLSAVGRRLRLPDMQRALTDPAASIPVGYTTATVTLKVIESAEGVRGDSANNVQKQAVLETGLQVQVPLFIKEGELVKVSTVDGKYLGRA